MLRSRRTHNATLRSDIARNHAMPKEEVKTVHGLRTRFVTVRHSIEDAMDIALGHDHPWDRRRTPRNQQAT